MVKIRRRGLQAEGHFGSRRVFFAYDNDCLLEPGSAFELGPDGACVDSDGCVWVAHYGGSKLVQVDPHGKQVRPARLPRGSKPTNLACRPQERLLYVTEAEFGLLYQMGY